MGRQDREAVGVIDHGGALIGVLALYTWSAFTWSLGTFPRDPAEVHPSVLLGRVRDLMRPVPVKWRTLVTALPASAIGVKPQSSVSI